MTEKIIGELPADSGRDERWATREIQMKVLAIVLVGLSLWAGAEEIRLSDLDLSAMTHGDGNVRVDTNVYGDPIVIAGETFAHGVGTHASSRYELEVVDGSVQSFESFVGLVNNYPLARQGSVVFRVRADGRTVAESPVLRFGDKAVPLKADLSGVKIIGLEVSDAGDGVANDLAAWVGARFAASEGTRLVPFVPAGEQLGILTPKSPEAPRINPPRTFGVRPGHPIHFTFPVSGMRPLAVSVRGLPKGASVDAATGRLSGSVARSGTYKLVVIATNAKGRDERAFRLVVGDRIALTPPMGWNSWNCFASTVTGDDIRRAADAFVRLGLKDYGWSYVNIDDFWQNTQNKVAKDVMGPFRRADGSVIANRRFGDMKALADYVHAQGLRIGLYSSPGPTTCGRCAGSWMHEEADAAQYAAWGFDYLKYDWCSYGNVAAGAGLKRAMAPYLLMGRALARQDRDIVFSICQYGMDRVSTWGAAAGGQCWRTTDDISDSWGSVLAIAAQQDGLEHFAGPGCWNDPDMLVVGRVGWGPKLRPTRLTPNEQYTHLTLWSMVAAPLLIGCDLTALDDFTLGLLTNVEVLEVDQDVLGKAGTRVRCDGWNEGVWVRPLEGGAVAVALVNLSSRRRTIRVDLEKDLGLCGAWRVRDLWRQRDEGVAEESYAADVPVHGPKFVRLTPLQGAGFRPGVADCRDRAWCRLFDGRAETSAGDCGCR